MNTVDDLEEVDKGVALAFGVEEQGGKREMLHTESVPLGGLQVEAGDNDARGVRCSEVETEENGEQRIGEGSGWWWLG